MAVASKRELRLKIKETLSALSDADRDRKSRALSANLKKSFPELPRKTIGAFAPLADEPAWHLELDDGPLQLCFPVITHNGMSFYAAKFNELAINSEFGLKLSTPPKTTAVEHPQLMLVPGLVFGRTGERLGRGKGYYDRYLANYSGLKIGVCFDEQVVDELPCEPHDQKVNWIVTDQEVFEVPSQNKRGEL